MVCRAGSKDGWRVRKYAVVQPMIPPPIITMFFRSLVVDIVGINKEVKGSNILGITITISQVFQNEYFKAVYCTANNVWCRQVRICSYLVVLSCHRRHLATLSSSVLHVCHFTRKQRVLRFSFCFRLTSAFSHPR